MFFFSVTALELFMKCEVLSLIAAATLLLLAGCGTTALAPDAADVQIVRQQMSPPIVLSGTSDSHLVNLSIHAM
jgi:predicted small lipoprotein YifL